MKKINYYLGALALASLSLGACSSDKLAGEEPNGPDNNVERKLYVNVSIQGENIGSRAAEDDGNPVAGSDFVDGTDGTNGTVPESKVTSCYLVFYDGGGNVVGQTRLNDQPTEGNTNITVETDGSIKKIVELTVAQGQANPEYVMCYINPANPADLQNPLSVIQTITREAAVNGDKNNPTSFPMSNSVYYLTNAGTATPQVAVPLEGKVYNSYDEAETAQEAGNTTNIYVERYAARLQMEGIATPTAYTTTNGDANLSYVGADYTANQEVALNFVVDGWTLNGEAKNTYAVKSLRQPSATGAILPNNYTWADANTAINGADGNWVWNNPDYHRSYWACSPVYFQSQYPEVLSDYQGHDDEYNQVFLPWNSIAAEGYHPGADGKEAPRYFKETTVGTRGLTSNNPNAAVASVVIAGHYNMTIGTSTVEAPTFYTFIQNNANKPSIYFSANNDNNDAASAVGNNTMSMQKRFLIRCMPIFYKANSVPMSITDATDLAKLATSTDILRPSDAVLLMAGQTTEEGGTPTEPEKMAARFRTLQFTEEALEDGTLDGLYIVDNGALKSIVATVTDANTQVTLDKANYILWKMAGTCVKYDMGAGFFNIPVRHYGYYRASNNGEAIDVAKSSVGDYGVVRNHAYTINVTKIEGLATGVGSKLDPIIPPADTKDIFMAYTINILRWAVVPTQDVEL